ncbi:MAG: filamentous hemagglutinin N-terminal domain-containing protein [Sterolibacterium sp.]|nr:filamentous hemagglutinin N-terminal domain-containing protein [Sterolibacterium sp.]
MMARKHIFPHSRILHTHLLAAVLACLCGSASHANPVGPQVISGTAAFIQIPNTLTINNSNNAILNWQQFNIAASEAVRFNQPSAASSVLNRVLGSDPSSILGQLSSNGKVWLINPAGILVGAGARIDTAGFIGSTLNLSNENFLAGKLTFGGNSNAGSITNQGTIATPEGGSVYLIAPNVSNQGLITTPKGETILAAGQSVKLIDTATPGVNVEVTGSEGNATNLGSIVSEAGRIGVAGVLVRNSGTLNASSVVNQGGRIFLKAQKNIELSQSSRIDASGSAIGGSIDIRADRRLIQTQDAVIDASGTMKGGSIAIASGQTDGGGAFMSGSLAANASQGAGGDITVTGRDLYFGATQIDANGATNGGQVRLGGDYQGRNSEVGNAWTNFVNTSTRISANGASGDGGRVIVWSDSQTTFGGMIQANGVTQDTGSFVEVSGKNKLRFAGTVHAKALLLDPKDIVIEAAGSIASFQLVDPNPWDNNNFGISVTEVGTGNIAVTSPGDSFDAAWAGAAYSFNGSTGALISTLRGSNVNDRVGSQGVTALTNGNYVVRSKNWNGNMGAATWGSGTTGVSGVVSSANSLVGSTAGDYVGDTVTVLSNGNYVVGSRNWNGDMGAATWGSGTVGVSGVVSSANSLVGSAANDYMGGAVTALSNGNYVVASNWNGDMGAATWGSGTAGVSGVVSSANSLVGSTAGDYVGNVIALSNGNYVVQSAGWNGNMGAVTWGSGTAGVSGVISSANSLVGSTANDYVGSVVTALSNGNYVAGSSSWNGGSGAVTWGSGTAGVSGVVSSANSLVGSTANDYVGDTVTALSNGNYVVQSAGWNGNMGAVTWGSGTAGVSGVVSSANSLVGSSANDPVGINVFALSNGNYVVGSPGWNGSRGAATWGSGTAGVSGVVSSANSLVGSAANDSVGINVFALSNGNYVVGSYGWNSAMGAATWGSGTAGVSGVVSSANSLVGSTANDSVGSAVTELSNGNYVVQSAGWNGNMGAATWGSGTAGVSGVVSSANSLVGSTANDSVGEAVTALSNGNYVVESLSWNGNMGAVTWGSGTAGVSGVVSSANSLVGSTANDYVGEAVTALSNGNYVVGSSRWNGTMGAVTWGSGTAGVSGVVSSANSLVGSTAGDSVGINVFALSNGNYVVRSQNWNGNMGAVTWGSGTAGVSGVVSSANSLVGSTAGDYVGGNGITTLSNGNYVVGSPNWNGDMGAVTWGSGTAGVNGVVSSANSLVGSTANDSVGSIDSLGSVVTVLSNGNYVVGSPYWTNGAFASSGRVDVMSGSGSGSGSATLPQTFATDPSATATLTPATLTATLNTGTAVTLQANNDITVNNAIVSNNASGNGGALTLQAGRSVLLNANITTDNGNLSFVANETAANGVIDANRDPGVANITMAAATTINAGTGSVSMTIGSGAGIANSNPGAISQGAGAAITAASLTASAAQGIALTGASNNVGGFTANNSSSGNIDLTNSSAISLGAISNTAAAGALNLRTDAAVVLNGPVSTSGGAFTVKDAAGTGPATSFTSGAAGTISTSGGSGLPGGSVTIQTSGAIVTQAITATGGSATTVGMSGGVVSIHATNGNITTGAIDTSGSAAAVALAGGDAGSVTVQVDTPSPARAISVGNIAAKGGSGGSSPSAVDGGAGGAGGNVFVIGTTNAAVNTGGIDTSGGAGGAVLASGIWGGPGGAAGLITVNSYGTGNDTNITGNLVSAGGAGGSAVSGGTNGNGGNGGTFAVGSASGSVAMLNFNPGGGLAGTGAGAGGSPGLSASGNTITGGPVTINAGVGALKLGGVTVSNGGGPAPITLIADRMALGGTADTVTAGTGMLWLKPSTAGWKIDLGCTSSCGDEAASTLELSAAELNTLTGTGTLRLGATTAGNLSLSGPVAPTGGYSTTGTLTFQSGGTIDQVAAPNIITADMFTVNAQGSVALDLAPNSVNSFTAYSSGTGNIAFKNAKSFLIPASKVTFGSVYLAGVSATSGNVSLSAPTAGNITVAGTVDGTGTITLSAANGAITGSGTISGSALNASAKNGIGHGAPLVTQVSSLFANNTTSNDIQINNYGTLSLGGVGNVGAGNIRIENTGSLTIAYPVSASGGGNVALLVHKNGNDAGAVSFGSTPSIGLSGSGHADLYYNPTDYLAPTYTADKAAYAAKVIGGPLNAWMLIDNVGQASCATNCLGLQAMSTNLAGNYALGNSIDASATSGWNGAAGFVPIGDFTTRFTGTFDGLGHTISNLNINRPTTDYVGLFGCTDTSSEIRDVGLVGGSIGGANQVGALVGLTYGSISNSYATSSVSGAGAVGGLLGQSNNGIMFSNNYATGSVSGTQYVGGLIGSNNNATISNSYATGSVSGTGNYIGGLVGASSGTVNNSYATGSVSGSSPVGGLVGSSTGTVNNSFWNITTSGQATSAGGTGLDTTQMQTATNFTGFIFTTTPGASGNNWVIVNGDGSLNSAGTSGGGTYPMLASEYSTSIANAHQLQLMAMALNTSYTLHDDIDASTTGLIGGISKDVWGSAGFVPVGPSGTATPFTGTPFTGTFDGLGRTVSNLFINRPSIASVGLFGEISHAGIIRNIGLEGVNLTGNNYIGGLAGVNGGSIANSYSSGAVNGGFNSNVGGLVGNNYAGAIMTSYSKAAVTGDTTTNVGGLVGGNQVDGGSYSTISQSYSTGIVTASGLPASAGGLAGFNAAGCSITNSYSTGAVIGGSPSYVGGLVGGGVGGSISNSFWDKNTSGQTTSVGGGIGLTTAEMMALANYTSATTPNGNVNPNWDFTTTWGIVEGVSYPYHQWDFPGGPQVLSGTVTNPGSPAKIILDHNGSKMGYANMGVNGFYYAALPAGTLAAGDKLVAFAGSASTRTYGGLVALTSAGHNTGLDYVRDALTLTAPSGGPPLTTARLLAAYTSSGNPYTVSGSTVELGNNSDPSAIVTSLLFRGAGRFNVADSGSKITTLAANSGRLEFTSLNSSLAIGSVGGVNGITSTEYVSIGTTGNITSTYSGTALTATGTVNLVAGWDGTSAIATPAVVAGTGDITLTGANIHSGGAMTVTAGNAIAVNASAGAPAGLESVVGQTITAKTLSVAAGASGSNKQAYISAGGAQNITLTGAGTTVLSLTASGSPGSYYNNYAVISSTAGGQSITFTGANAAAELKGGAGSSLSGTVPSGCTNCTGLSSSNFAGILNFSGNQTLDFQNSGGNLRLYGGSAGNANGAVIIDNATSGMQSIGSSGVVGVNYFPPVIALYGGTSGGAWEPNPWGGSYLANGAGITSYASQTVQAASITIKGVNPSGATGVVVAGAGIVQLNSSGSQSITANGAITLTGGDGLTAYPSYSGAGIFAGGSAGQSITAQSMSLTGGLKGSFNAAKVNATNGPQSITLTGGDTTVLSLTGGGSTGDSGNEAAIVHGNVSNQTITLTGSIAGITLQGGAGDGAGVQAGGCLDAGGDSSLCATSSNKAQIRNQGATQNIAFSQANGAIQIIGGTTGTNNVAVIESDGAVSISGSPDILLQSGASGGAAVYLPTPTIQGSFPSLGNDAGIGAGGAMTIHARDVTVDASTASVNTVGKAGLHSAGNLSLTATGNVALKGGPSDPVNVTNYDIHPYQDKLATAAMLGTFQTGRTTTLNVTGNLTLDGGTGGAGRALIGALVGAGNVSINVGGNLTLTGGPVTGASAIIGSMNVNGSATGTVTVAGTKTLTQNTGTAAINVTAPAPPPPPPPPTVSACIANPTLSGCSAVLPPLSTCTTNPTAAGCSAVLPPLSTCTANPAAAGCSAVLPPLSTCTTNPTAAGCSAVLPPLATCTTNPTAAGCSAVLPPIATCTTNPTAAGCSAVLPPLATCTTTPTAAGCSAVLPPLATCTTNPTAAGCSAVLPPLSTCTTTPTAAGCSAVLPPIATCTTTPTAAGCSAVLPPLATCTTNPTAAGCSAVLPPLATCTTNPTAAGCSAVLPPLATCTTNPTAAGCSAVLPPLSSCTTNPTAAGCSAVLPPLSTCTTTPTAAGCSAVLPPLAACTTNPTAAGCSAVLPPLSSCTTNPTAAGCSAVLPPLATCTTNPTAAGCSAVLPPLSGCTTNPTAAGCSAVLPPLSTCTTPPPAAGCSAVLPPLATCTTNPTAAGCSAVLPPIATCTTNPTAAGCSAVLPPLATCTTNPTAAGCSAVLPPIATCTTNPTAAGCSAVLPPVASCATDPTLAGCSVVLPPAAPAAKTVVTNEVIAVTEVVSKPAAKEAATAAPPPPPPPPPTITTSSASGPTTLLKTNQTIGGTEGTFGGSSAPTLAAPRTIASTSSTASSFGGSGSSSSTSSAGNSASTGSTPSTSSSANSSTSGTASSSPGTSGTSSASDASGGSGSSSSGSEKSAADKPAADKPAGSKPAESKPDESKSADKTSGEEKKEDKKDDKKDDKKEDKKEETAKKQDEKPAAKKPAMCS